MTRSLVIKYSYLRGSSPIKSYVVNCFFLIALLLLCPPSLATADDFSSAICSGTLDPIFCFQVLKTIPGARQAASLESLEGTVISFSLSKGNEIHEYVQSLAGAKDVYSNCAKIYGEFMGRLQNAQGMLKSKDYRGVLNMASNCINGVAACSDSLKDVSVAYKSELLDKNKYFYTLSLIILISNKLVGAV